MIQELLRQFGLTDKEALVYLTVLEQGKTTPILVSKTTKINRTTVYSVAKELVSKGLLTEDLGGKTTYLVALPPQEIKTFIDREERALTSKKEIAATVIAELQNISKNTKYSIPKISFIEEKNIMDFLHKRTPIWNESVVGYDKQWWGFQDKTFIKDYEKWIDWFWETAAPASVQLKLLSNESAESIKNKKFANRQIKFWNKGNDFTATTWIAGDFTIMIITSQRPHYLVEIHDATLAHNMRELFKGIWDSI